MGIAATLASIFAVAGIGLLNAFPDKAADPRPAAIMPVAVSCLAIALAIIIGIAWVAASDLRSRARSKGSRTWKRRWMPGGMREAHLTKKYGERARINKGSWQELTVGANSRSSFSWQCPYCFAGNSLSESECIGCHATLDHERERVKPPAPTDSAGQN